jgi:hypothetical protein
MKTLMQRIRACIKRERTFQIVEDSDALPLLSTESAAEVAEETFSEKSIQSTGLKNQWNGRFKANQECCFDVQRRYCIKVNGDAMSKPIGEDDQKPIENNARKTEKNTVASSTQKPKKNKFQSEVDYSRYSFWRLSHLVRTEVDTVKLLCSTLVFVMFATFDADLSKIERDTGSLLPWSTTVSTKYADSSAVYWWNVSKITQELSTLVWLLEHTMENNHWFNARRQHKDLLIQLVFKPVEDLKIQADSLWKSYTLLAGIRVRTDL